MSLIDLTEIFFILITGGLKKWRLLISIYASWTRQPWVPILLLTRRWCHLVGGCMSSPEPSFSRPISMKLVSSLTLFTVSASFPEVNLELAGDSSRDTIFQFNLHFFPNFYCSSLMRYTFIWKFANDQDRLLWNHVECLRLWHSCCLVLYRSVRLISTPVKKRHKILLRSSVSSGAWIRFWGILECTIAGFCFQALL